MAEAQQVVHVSPRDLKSRVDRLYHRILEAEVSARLNEQTHKRESLEKELYKASNVSSVNRETENLAVSKPRQKGPREAEKRRANLFQQHRRSVKAGDSRSINRQQKNGAVPIVRQFRHKHEILDDLKDVEVRLNEAKERLAKERAKNVIVDDEYQEVAHNVHKGKDKVKSLVALIRSLVLSTAASPKSQSKQLIDSKDTDEDVMGVIDNRLHSITHLLPEYESEANRIRSVVYDDMDGGKQHLPKGALPETVGQVRFNFCSTMTMLTR